MKNYIKERAMREACYIVNNKSTVRGTANEFKVSKSTVHLDISHRLPEIDKNLYLKVREVLNFNKSIRHLRGGLATKEMYKKKVMSERSERH